MVQLGGGLGFRVEGFGVYSYGLISLVVLCSVVDLRKEVQVGHS